MTNKDISFWSAWFVSILLLIAVSSLLAQESPIAGDKRGDRCYDGIRWRYCNEPKPSPAEVAQLGLRPTNEWTHQECFFSSCVEQVLGSLSYEQATTAKLTVYEKLTYIWYRK